MTDSLPPGLSPDPLIRFNQFREDPWLFLKFCVFTHDEVDQDQPIKPFPSHFTYLYFIVQMWLRHKKIAVPKSRRMTVSWLMIGLTLWDCIFHKGRSWAFTSKKEEDAKELVKRAEFIYKNIPPEMIDPALLPRLKRDEMQSSPPVLDFEAIHSKIQGFPQGGNQLRQRGFSGILEDECAFQEESEKTYVAAEPTIKGGGRMVKVSSRATEDKGFFKRIVFDKLNAPNGRFPEIAPVPVKSPMEGVDVWLNPENGFLVIDLHYTANPAKRGALFRDGLKKTLPIRQYRMEYEKSWETFEGRPVYEDFNELVHVTRVRPQYHIGLPLLIGWDSSGLTPAAVLAQLQGEQLIIFREIVGQGMGAARFVPHVAQEIAQHYPMITDLREQTISFFDPAAFKKSELTEQTYLSYMIAGGFRQIRPGPMGWKKRVESVVEWLIGLSRGQAKFLIFEEDCPTLVAGFKGGFRYPDSVSESEPDAAKPIKDIHSHPHDGLQYLCGGLKSYRGENYQAKPIPGPSYGFQKRSAAEETESKPGKGFGRPIRG